MSARGTIAWVRAQPSNWPLQLVFRASEVADLRSMARR